MTAGKSGKHEAAGIRLTRVHINLGAGFHHGTNAVHITEVQFRVNTLAVHIHAHNDDIQIAGAFTITKQGSFDTLCTGHHA